MSNNIAHLMQIILISKKYFAVVNGEYATISDFADLPRREQFYIASSGIEIVVERDAIMQVKYFAVGFPNGDIHRVAAVKHSASRGDVYRTCHYLNV